MYRVWNFLTNYSLLLIAGALIALVWANVDAASYHHFVDFVIVCRFVLTSGSTKPFASVSQLPQAFLFPGKKNTSLGLWTCKTAKMNEIQFCLPITHVYCQP